MTTEEIQQKLKRIDTDLEEIGVALTDKIPQSPTLKELTDEISAAHAGLESLLEKLEEAIMQAKVEEGLRKDLVDQMEKIPLYQQKLTQPQREKLAEFITQQKGSLQTEEELIAFYKDRIQSMNVDDVALLLTKDYLIDVGNQTHGAGQPPPNFDAYQAGLEEVKRILQSEEGDEFRDLIAQKYVTTNPQEILELFYKGLEL